MSDLELQQAARKGLILPETLITKKDSKKWVQAKNVKNLFQIKPSSISYENASLENIESDGKINISKIVENKLPTSKNDKQGVINKLEVTDNLEIIDEENQTYPNKEREQNESELIKRNNSQKNDSSNKNKNNDKENTQNPPKRKSLLVTSIFIALILSPCFLIPPMLGLDVNGGESMARVMAKEIIEKRLRSPRTAVFPWNREIAANKTGENEWEIIGYVDAQNGFGAMIRSNWKVKLKYEGKGNWKTIYASID